MTANVFRRTWQGYAAYKGDVLSYGNHLPSYASEFYDPHTNIWKRI